MATQRIGVHITDGKPHDHGQHAPTKPLAGISGSEGIHTDEIEAQLQRILASPSFRNSKRSMHFLRFVVEKALAGTGDEIKERLIGIEVFDRRPDYDLSADPIVRVAAVELRKRIAQYYAEPDHAGDLRLELPVGTYVPLFHWPNSTHKESEILAAAVATGRPTSGTTTTDSLLDPPAQAVNQRASTRMIRTLVAGFILIAAIGALFAADHLRMQLAQRSLDEFWAPLMNGGQTITVCVGDLNYIFKTPGLSHELKLPPTADNLLNPNAGAALLRVGSILGSRGKRSTLRFADLTGLNDLRQQPVIFIGGLNNPWTLRILTGLRFQLTNKPGGIGGDYSLIVDEKNPAMAGWRTDTLAPFSSITRDYSLVTRINDPLTGEPVVILCGLGPYGTAAASEFVSSPDYFSQFTRLAPKGWQSHNIQIVLETRVVDGRVSVPRVLAEEVY